MFLKGWRLGGHESPPFFCVFVGDDLKSSESQIFDEKGFCRIPVRMRHVLPSTYANIDEI